MRARRASLDTPIDGDLANLEAVLEFTVNQGNGVTTAGMLTVPYLNLTQAQ